MKIDLLGKLAFLSVIFLTACRGVDTEPKVISADYPPHSSMILRMAGVPDQVPADRYLGKSFDLVRFRPNNEMGFVDNTILDLSRINNDDPWDPMNVDPNYTNIMSPEAGITYYPATIPVQLQELEQVSDKYNQEDISFNAAGSIKAVTLSFSRDKKTNATNKFHIIQSSMYKPEKKVYFTGISGREYYYFLSNRFVKSLSRRSAEQLVDMWGTHIVGAYYTGAYYDLAIMASAEIYSESQTKEIAAKYIKGDSATLSASTLQVLKNNAFHVTVQYQQGGSTYIPAQGFLQPSSLYTQSGVRMLDPKAWAEGIVRNDNALMRLSLSSNDLIPIPDLIPNIPYKIKYTAGILNCIKKVNHPNERVMTSYVLCDPKECKPIKLNGKFLIAYLRDFRSIDEVDINVGTNSIYDSNLGFYLPAYKRGTDWDLTLNNDAYWTIKHPKDGTYLCRDLKQRTEAEDPDGMRFWLLNPILTGDGGPAKGVYNMYIQSK